MAVQVRAGNEAHTGVFRISVVNRQPHRDGLRWRQRPVARVLMPAHPFAVVWRLAKIVRSPPDDVLAQQIIHYGDDARMPEQVINLRVSQMRCADRITVASGGDDSFEQAVEVAAMRGDLVFIEDAKGFEKTVAVERVDLLSRESRRIFYPRCVKAQVPIDLIEFCVVGDDFELRSLSHRGSPTLFQVCVTKLGPGDFTHRSPLRRLSSARSIS